METEGNKKLKLGEVSLEICQTFWEKTVNKNYRFEYAFILTIQYINIRVLWKIQRQLLLTARKVYPYWSNLLLPYRKRHMLYGYVLQNLAHILRTLVRRLGCVLDSTVSEEKKIRWKDCSASYQQPTNPSTSLIAFFIFLKNIYFNLQLNFSNTESRLPNACNFAKSF